MRERDLAGYSGRPPHAQWPGQARVAVQFVLNVEEGAESSIVNGDAGSEALLHEMPGRTARLGERDPSVESLYEYGSRAGVWRILEMFHERALPLTAFAVGRALELSPRLGQALAEAGHEIAGHGWRWIDYHGVAVDEERRHIRQTIATIERVCGRRPVGWYTGKVSLNTRQLLREEGGFLYDSDVYDDDLPHWLPGAPPHLLIPYSLVTNDFRYLLPTGPASGDEFFGLLKDAFDVLWHEGAQRPKMMSVGLHGRISGHPARAMALMRFLDHVQRHDAVWLCRREDIARHWRAQHPAAAPAV